MGNEARARELLRALDEALKENTFYKAWNALKDQEKQWCFEYAAQRFRSSEILMSGVVREYLLRGPKLA